MTTQSNERASVEKLRMVLDIQPRMTFLSRKELKTLPLSQGVYLIRDRNGVVLHVGRTVSGQKGLAQRLENHRSGKSSFVKIHLNGNRELLISKFTFQYIVVEDDRERALLENHAIAWYCPVHLGLGRKADLTAYPKTEARFETR